MKKNLHIRVDGEMGGTLFRQEARQQAERLGLFGYVQYEPDGTLHIEAEGDPDQLEKLQQWCHQGPEGTRVSAVRTEDGSPQGFDRFLERR